MAAGCIQEWIDYDLNSRWIRRYYTYPTGRWSNWKEVPLFKEQFIKSSEKDAANGVAILNNNGALPSKYFPESLTNLLVYWSKDDFPTAGKTGKAYFEQSTRKIYVYNGVAGYKEYTEHIGIGVDFRDKEVILREVKYFDLQNDKTNGFFSARSNGHIHMFNDQIENEKSIIFGYNSKNVFDFYSVDNEGINTSIFEIRPNF